MVSEDNTAEPASGSGMVAAANEVAKAVAAVCDILDTRVSRDVQSSKSSKSNDYRRRDRSIDPVSKAPKTKTTSHRDMAIMDSETDRELMRLWSMITQMSDQLGKNKQIAAALASQSTSLKVQAVHNETGYVLRRFNTHLSQDEYDAELERMNNALSQENQGLQYDNKQLNSLMKEYEQSLESIMSTFRGHAHEVQQRELALMRYCETMLIEGETQLLQNRLDSDTSVSLFVAKVSHLLRMVVRLLGGEDPVHGDSIPPSPTESNTEELDIDRRESRGYVMISEDDDGMDWVLQRETELVRLEKENEELKRLLVLATQSIKTTPNQAPSHLQVDDDNKQRAVSVRPPSTGTKQENTTTNPSTSSHDSHVVESLAKLEANLSSSVGLEVGILTHDITPLHVD